MFKIVVVHPQLCTHTHTHKHTYLLQACTRRYASDDASATELDFYREDLDEQAAGPPIKSPQELLPTGVRVFACVHAISSRLFIKFRRCNTKPNTLSSRIAVSEGPMELQNSVDTVQ